jgi:DNA-binding response OmpR family regulator
MNKIRSFIAHKPALKRHFQGKKIKTVQDIRILLIDDEPAMLNLLESYLSSKYQVDSAIDREGALKKISSVRYDVIISDVHMPGFTGIDIYKEATAADSSLGKRFIFITGDTSAVYRRFFEENSIPYLYKPISLDLIEDRIREVLTKS